MADAGQGRGPSFTAVHPRAPALEAGPGSGQQARSLQSPTRAGDPRASQSGSQQVQALLRCGSALSFPFHFCLCVCKLLTKVLAAALAARLPRAKRGAGHGRVSRLISRPLLCERICAARRRGRGRRVAVGGRAGRPGRNVANAAGRVPGGAGPGRPLSPVLTQRSASAWEQNKARIRGAGSETTRELSELKMPGRWLCAPAGSARPRARCVTICCTPSLPTRPPKPRSRLLREDTRGPTALSGDTCLSAQRCPARRSRCERLGRAQHGVCSEGNRRAAGGLLVLPPAQGRVIPFQMTPGLVRS